MHSGGITEILASSNYTASNSLSAGAVPQVAVDGQGNVFVISMGSDFNSYSVGEYPFGCTASNCSKLLFAGGAINSTGIAVDKSGNIFFTETPTIW